MPVYLSRFSVTGVYKTGLLQKLLLCFVLSSGVISCSSNEAADQQGATYTIGGQVSGLQSGSLVLQVNNTDNLTITSNGSFTFPGTFAVSSPYNVTVLTQPADQACRVDNGMGDIFANNITDVSVVCTLKYSISGSVSGLVGSGLAIELSLVGGVPSVVTPGSDGVFSFEETIADSTDFDLRVLTQPSSPLQECNLNYTSGQVSGSDVTDITVTCLSYYTVGGTLSGLTPNDVSGLTILLNSNAIEIDGITLDQDGIFVFDVPVLDGDTYSVAGDLSVLNDFRSCTISNGNGVITGVDVDNISIVCVDNTYSIGGTVTGLLGTGLVLQNNGTDDLNIDANGSFTFDTTLGKEAVYVVRVATQPSTPSQDCIIKNGAGTLNTEADITNIQIICPVVQPVYSNSGLNWNDYVVNDGTTAFDATDVSCKSNVAADAVGYDSCLHAGELKKVATNESSCTGLSASDALDVFDWICDDSTGQAIFYSTGLKDGARLSDLINFTTQQWKQNRVIIDGVLSNTHLGGASANETPDELWWLNIIQRVFSSTELSIPGVIYIVTINPSTPLDIKADKIALVTAPGITLTGGSTINETVVHNSVGPLYHLWLEANINANTDLVGVNLQSVNYSMINGLLIRNANAANGNGLMLTADNSHLMDIEVINSANAGIVINQSSGLGLINIYSHDNGGEGVVVTDGDQVNIKETSVYNNSASGMVINGAAAMNMRVYRVKAMNNAGSGIDNQANQAQIIDVVAANNAVDGVTLSGVDVQLSNAALFANGQHGLSCTTGANQLWLNLTIANNAGRGVMIDDCDAGRMQNTVVLNNASDGVQMLNTDSSVVHNLVSAHNGAYGVHTGSASDTAAASTNLTYTGVLKVGSNTAGDCLGDTDGDGLISTTCTDDGTDGSSVYNNESSDAFLTTAVDLTTSFVAKVITDDTINVSDNNNTDNLGPGLATYDNINDWLNFDNVYRGWGIDGSDFIAADQQGHCDSSMTCRIWDWSLNSADTVLLSQLTLHANGDATDSISHVLSTATETFLMNAIEVMADSVGDDDGLCESNETCIYTPNLGSYPGHGDLTDTVFTDGDTLSGITLHQYINNGY